MCTKLHSCVRAMIVKYRLRCARISSIIVVFGRSWKIASVVLFPRKYRIVSLGRLVCSLANVLIGVALRCHWKSLSPAAQAFPDGPDRLFSFSVFGSWQPPPPRFALALFDASPPRRTSRAISSRFVRDVFSTIRARRASRAPI